MLLLLLLRMMGDALDELLMYGRRQRLPTSIDLGISRSSVITSSPVILPSSHTIVSRHCPACKSTLKAMCRNHGQPVTSSRRKVKQYILISFSYFRRLSIEKCESLQRCKHRHLFLSTCVTPCVTHHRHSDTD